MNTIRNYTTGRFERTIPTWTPDIWDAGYVDNKGRFRVYRPDYPRAYKGGFAMRAHVVWWLAHGEPHPVGFDIHHEDKNKLNDSIDNLVLKEHSNHTVFHCKKEGIEFICEICGKKFRVPEWRIRSRIRDGYRIRFCSQICYHSTRRSDAHKEHISNGLRRAYKEGRR